MYFICRWIKDCRGRLPFLCLLPLLILLSLLLLLLLLQQPLTLLFLTSLHYLVTFSPHHGVVASLRYKTHALYQAEPRDFQYQNNSFRDGNAVLLIQLPAALL